LAGLDGAMKKRKLVARKSPASRIRHTVRIIGGQWKRTPVAVIDAAGLRPTPERVRETLFNWLGHFWHGNFLTLACLDMFAGTGALGFEAASRGFRHVTMIEKNRIALKQLQAVRLKLDAGQIEILSGDAFAVCRTMAKMRKQFDLVCIDPPFHEHLLPDALSLCRELLAGKGLVYVESDVPVTEQLLDDCGMLDCLRIIRQGRAGQVCYHLLEKTVS